MQEKEYHIEQYSAATLQQYLKGELPVATMHAIEKAALDDPFLADAIEGMELAMQQQQEEAVAAQLASIRQQVQARTTVISGTIAPVRSLRWWRVAAAAIFIITAGASAYYWLSPASSTSPNVAAVAPVPQQPAPAPPVKYKATDSIDNITTDVAADKVAPSTHQPAANATLSQSSSKLNKEQTEEKKLAKAFAQKQFTADSQMVADYGTFKRNSNSLSNDGLAARLQTQQPGVQAKQDTLAFNTHELQQNRNTETQVVTLGSNIKPQQSTTANKPEFISGQNDGLFNTTIRGQVTDNQNNPLSNVLVKVELNNNRNISYSTDNSGYFTVPVSKADSTVTVAVNAVGYKNQQFRLLNNSVPLQQLRLQPFEHALSEVVVTQSSKEDNGKSKARQKIIVQSAQPESGWVAYETYLSQNKRIPAGNPNVTGNVVVSFDISRKGLLTRFKVEQSLTDDYDNEAIRLIKEGPAWKLLQGKKTRMTVIVHF